MLASCDLGKDTADTTEKGTNGATGVAEKMHEGTLGGEDVEGE